MSHLLASSNAIETLCFSLLDSDTLSLLDDLRSANARACGEAWALP